MAWSESDCNEVLNLIERYVDAEVPADTRASIDHHLEGCPECLSHKDFRVRLQEIIQRKCKEELPEGLADRIRRALAGSV